MSNAIKFTDKGSIETKTIEDNKKIIITVRDTGIGIKEDNRKNLFKAFASSCIMRIPHRKAQGLVSICHKR